MKIENFSPRDRFLFNPAFMLRLDTTPGQIKTVLEKLKSILLQQNKVNPDPARVKLVAINKEGIKVEVFAFIDTIDGNEFMDIQENLYLDMLDAIEGSGTQLAMPSQTVYIANTSEGKEQA